MSELKDFMNETSGEIRGAGVARVFKWIFLGGAAFVVIGLLMNFLGVFGSIGSAPGRVIGKTLQTGNIIHSYEWFHDTNAAYQARMNQIRAYSQMMESTPGNEKLNMGMELQAMRQSCRDLATRYNANSAKVNVGIFKGTNVPDSLNLNSCEG